VVAGLRHRYPETVTPRLPSRPLSVLVGLALLAPVGASAADSPAPLAAPSNPNPVAATPKSTTPPASTTTTTTTTTRRTSTPVYHAPATVNKPAGPTPAQLAAAKRARQQTKAKQLAAARKHRHQMQLLAAAQAHAEAVLRAELTAAKRTNAVELLAGSVTQSIGAAPAEQLVGAPTASGSSSSGGGSMPLPALMLGACAALLGIGAAFASRRGVGFATASLSLLVLLLAGI
jgi:hypothetical protein